MGLAAWFRQWARLQRVAVGLCTYECRSRLTAEMGGTLSVPGSHLRRINETDIGRVQNLRGQTRLTCPAGTVVLVHHGTWHGGRRNDTARRRFMYKLRLNPTVPQVRLWDTSDPVAGPDR